MSATPGPWDFCCDSYGKVRHSKKAAVYLLSSSRASGPTVTVARVIENWDDARLIAAAPDLLAACKAVLEVLEADELSYDECETVRAAIAKAEGKP